MQLAEIKNGRVAMVAITAFAFQEFAAHTAVIDQVPFLFKPIWSILSENVPSYYIPDDVDVAETVSAITSTASEAVTSVIPEPAAIVEPAAIMDSVEAYTQPPVQAAAEVITA